jgi:hypothetical protein
MRAIYVYWRIAKRMEIPAEVKISAAAALSDTT